MKQNMGKPDRILRILAVIAIAVLYVADVISGTLALILGIVAIAFVITSLVGVCPLYLPLKLSTKKPSV